MESRWSLKKRERKRRREGEVTVGRLPGDKLRKFIKNVYNAHTHNITHAACAATGAVYPTDTAISSTQPSKKA